MAYLNSGETFTPRCCALGCDDPADGVVAGEYFCPWHAMKAKRLLEMVDANEEFDQ